MFGYIRICKPQMKICEYEIYQSVYCTLCRCMGRKLGPPARLLLSYDYTFLTIIMLALEGSRCSVAKGRCVYNPLKRCGKYLSDSSAFEYTSALTAIMFYHKLRDNINDSKGAKRLACRLLMPYAGHLRRKAVRLCSDEDEIVGECISRQFELEARASAGEDIVIDQLCEPTATAISRIAQRLSSKQSDKVILNYFGYFMGRWIYMIDALDDLGDDILSGSFNPLAAMYSLTAEDLECHSESYEQARQFGNESLNFSISEATKYYELLDLGEFKPVLDNIMYKGISDAQRSALFDKDKTGTKKKGVDRI